MSFYKEMDSLHNRLLIKFHETLDSRYLGAANCLVEAINYIAEVENILSDIDRSSIVSNYIKSLKVDSTKNF